MIVIHCRALEFRYVWWILNIFLLQKWKEKHFWPLASNPPTSFTIYYCIFKKQTSCHFQKKCLKYLYFFQTAFSSYHKNNIVIQSTHFNTLTMRKTQKYKKLWSINCILCKSNIYTVHAVVIAKHLSGQLFPLSFYSLFGRVSGFQEEGSAGLKIFHCRYLQNSFPQLSPLMYVFIYFFICC